VLKQKFVRVGAFGANAKCELRDFRQILLLIRQDLPTLKKSGTVHPKTYTPGEGPT